MQQPNGFPANGPGHPKTNRRESAGPAGAASRHRAGAGCPALAFRRRRGQPFDAAELVRRIEDRRRRIAATLEAIREHGAQPQYLGRLDGHADALGELLERLGAELAKYPDRRLPGADQLDQLTQAARAARIAREGRNEGAEA